MYRNLTYLLKNGAFPWADWSLTCQLKNRQVCLLTGLIAQIPCNSYQWVLAEEGPGFKVVKKLHWAVVDGLLFLNRRWLLPGDLCHFSILPDTPSLLPIIFVLFFWANGKVSGSGTIIFYICIHRVLVLIWEHQVLALKVYVIDLSRVWEDWRETTEGFGVSLQVCRGHLGSWECYHSWNWAPSLSKIRPLWYPSANLTWVLQSLSASLLLPAADRGKPSLSSFLAASTLYSFYFCFLHMQAYRKFCPQLLSSQSFLFAL